jgi:glycosyltransferase involved in cell wall biosynthesis
MPCLNEAETLGRCILKAREFLVRTGIDGEILVADNGSHDGSRDVAQRHGARVIDVPSRGYGNAIMAGVRSARGRFVIMGDSDDSYDFSALDAFILKLRQGYHLVMGNRFRGGIQPGAMPALHRYLGNPVLSGLGRLFFKSPCGDFHCGLRGFDRSAILSLNLQSAGMEFASEMVVRATLQKLRIADVPTTLSQDGRTRSSHLRSWRDGWRHLRFLLLFSPRWLFLYPGLLLFVAGLLAMAWLLPQPRMVGNFVLDIHTLLYAAAATTVGFQSMLFWVFANVYAMQAGFAAWDASFRTVISVVTLEAGLIAGGVLLIVGIGLGAYALSSWNLAGFGDLRPAETMRLVIPSATAILLAFQVATGAFFISVLEIRPNRAPDEHVASEPASTRAERTPDAVLLERDHGT